MMTNMNLLADRRIAILGLGLMGGSLALALRGRVAALVAVDSDPATQALAIEHRIVDRVVASLEEAISLADVIILAAPVRVILEHIQFLGEYAQRIIDSQSVPPGKKIVLDLGSTKRVIMDAMQTLPESYDPIGGHPMCGKETSGLVNADAAIYQGATFAFTPLDRTSSQARAFAETLAGTVGANPIWLDAGSHDRWVATTSHLPYLLANTLAAITPIEAAPLVGPGFRSTSRLASASQKVMMDILHTNRQPLLEALHRFQTQTKWVESLLAREDYSALTDLLAAAAKHHQALLHPKAWGMGGTDEDRIPG